MNFQFGPEVGAEETRFRLWAPGATELRLELDGDASFPLQATRDGWHEARVRAGPGSRYRFILPGGERVPDPASRWQPEGVHGPSAVTDAKSYRWRTTGWRGRPWQETILYELHVGLFGGYEGVASALGALADLGITAVELMPISEFSGRRNWGYDGVLPFAPDSDYGTPDALKELIDRAHELGIMMFLDVVYNHFGPDGNFLPLYAPEFFDAGKPTPWGAAIDYRVPQVRRFFIENALYWLGEFRFDGLRLDAVHAISETDWIPEMAARVRAAFPDRHMHLVVENENNEAAYLRRGVDAQWNDDFHNVMHVLLTGETSSYYDDFAQRPTERLARALAQGFIYQGEPSSHRQGRPRGTPSADLPAAAFVNFLQNHDQVGNRALGDRLIGSIEPEALKAASALLLLCPAIPLLFMGEEKGTKKPFLFFTDFHDALADALPSGRDDATNLPPFRPLPTRAAARRFPDPNAKATFEACRIDRKPESVEWLEHYRRLIAVRRTEIVPRLRGTAAIGAEPIGEKAVRARWRLGDGSTLTLLVNLSDVALPLEVPEGKSIWGEPADVLRPLTTLAWVGPA